MNIYFSHEKRKEQPMRKRFYLPLMIMLFVVGCATTIKPTYVDPTGRQLPIPHYVLQDLSGELTFTFYYTLFEKYKDLDGTVLRSPQYLDLLKFHEFERSEDSEIVLTIEVLNPKQIEYYIWQKVRVVNQDNTISYLGGELASSNSRYRCYNFQLPKNNTVKEVNFGLDVINSYGNIIMRIGDFRYEITK